MFLANEMTKPIVFSHCFIAKRCLKTHLLSTSVAGVFGFSLPPLSPAKKRPFSAPSNRIIFIIALSKNYVAEGPIMRSGTSGSQSSARTTSLFLSILDFSGELGSLHHRFVHQHHHHELNLESSNEFNMLGSAGRAGCSRFAG